MSDEMHEKAMAILAQASSSTGDGYLLARICAALERLADIEATGVEAEIAQMGDSPVSTAGLCPHRVSFLACAACAEEYGSDGP